MNQWREQTLLLSCLVEQIGVSLRVSEQCESTHMATSSKVERSESVNFVDFAKSKGKVVDFGSQTFVDSTCFPGRSSTVHACQPGLKQRQTSLEYKIIE